MHNSCSDESAGLRWVRFDMCGWRMLLREMIESSGVTRGGLAIRRFGSIPERL
ncbi:hypothetical protein ABVT39_022462, partial [Epinephelus coioides]